MNDWLDYKGSGSSRAYMGDTIAHKKGPLYDNSQEALYKQREAYDRLSKALIENAYKQLDELKAVQESVTKIDDTIRQKTKEDKNYNANGLLQRKKAYLVRRSTVNNELNKTINEIMNTRKKMMSECGYSPLEVMAVGGDPDWHVKFDVNDIKFKQKMILKYS